MRSRSPSPSAGESARLLNPSAASSAAAAPPTADAPSRRMLLVCLAGVACSTSSVITDEIVDLYAMQQLRLSAATWGRIASAGSASVSLGLLGVAVVVGRAGTRRLGSIALACLGGVLVLLCAVRLELFVLLLGLSLVCRDAAYVCCNSLCQCVHGAGGSGSDADRAALLNRSNMWYRIATNSAAIVAPVLITQATVALGAPAPDGADEGAVGQQPYGLVVGVAGVAITLAGALLWHYPPSIGTEPAPASAAATKTAAGSGGLVAELGGCWRQFVAPFADRPGLLRFVCISTAYEAFSFMGAMQFGVYRLVTDLKISSSSFGWLCSVSAVCGLGAIALVAKLSTIAGVQPTLVGLYGSQSAMLLVIGLTDSQEISVAAFFIWRVLDRSRWAPYSVWTSILTGGGANDKTAMFAMQKVMRAAPSALVQVCVLAPVAEGLGLKPLFSLCAVCAFGATFLLARLPPPQ